MRVVQRYTVSMLRQEWLTQDLRQAFRVLQKNKFWTVVAVVTLGLGIAPGTAMFSLVDRVYSPPSIDRPDELVYSRAHDLKEYEQIRDHNSTLAGLLAYDRDERRYLTEVLSHRGTSEVEVEFISGNYYDVAGVAALRGRTIQPGDDLDSSSPVAMISEPYWERAFNRNSSVIGETIEMHQKSFTIIGVWPNRFVDVGGEIVRNQSNGPQRPDIMVPLARHPKLSGVYPFVAGRKKPGVTLAQVNSDTGRLRQRDDLSWRNPPFKERRYGLGGIVDAFQGNAVTLALIVVLLVGSFGAPLFLSCVNIATFLLSRAEDRRVEIAVRLSLGASRARLMTQLLVENLVLASLAACVGILFASWWTRILANPPFTNYGDLTMNWKAFAFVALLVLPVGIGCGLMPALDVTKGAARMMQAFGTHFSRSKSERTRSLIAIQIALSFFGLFCAGLMFRTVQKLGLPEVAYKFDNVATFRIDPKAAGLNYDKERTRALYEDIVVSVSRVPGIQSVSFSDLGVVNEPLPTAPLFVRDANRRTQNGNATWLGVDARFFRTMGLSFVLGVPFAAQESAAMRDVVVNEALALSLFPAQNPLGKRFGRQSTNLEAFEIVGVVKDAEPSVARPTVYTHEVCCAGSKTFEVRAAGSPAPFLKAIQAAVRDVAPNLPLHRLSIPRDDFDAAYLSTNRPWKLMLNYYSGLATFLVITGVFGLMSHSVARRTREIGIRMAIGAQRREVLMAVLLEALRMAIPGVIIGLAATLVASRLLIGYVQTSLPAFDVPVLVISTLMMFVIASIAGYVPARRASRVDPIVALRHD